MKKIKRFLGLSLLISLLLWSVLGGSKALATPIVIDPSDDGSVYPLGSPTTHAYLQAGSGGLTQGVVEFSMNSITAPITEAYLSVNPYGLPLWDPSVDIYGYESSDGVLTSLDYNAGTFLGTLMLPAGLGYGEDAFFDVTNFLQTVTSSYVGFNLRADKVNQFSSLEYNYGHPAQLTVAMVPEPSTMLLLLLGVLGLVGVRKLKIYPSR